MDDEVDEIQGLSWGLREKTRGRKIGIRDHDTDLEEKK